MNYLHLPPRHGKNIYVRMYTHAPTTMEKQHTLIYVHHTTHLQHGHEHMTITTAHTGQSHVPTASSRCCWGEDELMGPLFTVCNDTILHLHTSLDIIPVHFETFEAQFWSLEMWVSLGRYQWRDLSCSATQAVCPH